MKGTHTASDSLGVDQDMLQSRLAWAQSFCIT